MESKSPFFVVEDFLSPKQSDQIVDALNIVECDEDPHGNPIKSTRYNPYCESIIFNKLEDIKEEVERYYSLTWDGTTTMTFEFFPEECADGLQPECSNSVMVNNKWTKVRNRDLTGIVFLSDYNTDGDENFDPSFEVFGGRLQFPVHKFSFNPKRGTLVLFPAGPHFIHAISPIYAGDLFLVRFHVSSRTKWTYSPSAFPGNFRHWFQTKAPN